MKLPEIIEELKYRWLHVHEQRAVGRRLFLGGSAALGVLGLWYAAKGIAAAAKSMGLFGSSLGKYLPEGFEELEFGMAYEEVKKIRPFMKESAKNERSAYEVLEDKLFGEFPWVEYTLISTDHGARYKFDKENRLRAIIFVPFSNGGKDEDALEKFFVDKYGKPKEKRYWTSWPDDFVWEKDENMIILDAVMLEKKTTYQLVYKTKGFDHKQ